MRQTARAVAIVVLTAILAGCGGAVATAGSGETGGGETGGETAVEPTGGEVSDFALKDVDGKTHALSDYQGDKVILISFWATWCEPCKKEMVKLQELFEAHEAKGLMIFSISMDEPESQGEVRPFVKQRGYTYPVLLDTESQVTDQLNPRRAAPYSLIIDKAGQVAWTHEGYVPGDEKKLEQAVLEALGTAGE